MDFSGPRDGTGNGRDPAGDSDSTAPSRAEIDAALARILTSRPFAAAPRQQALLQHIIGETLEKRGDRLKEFSIAMDVFGRASTFDPRTDSIVRVQASRLRTQLAEYYSREGAAETLRVEVPAGGYLARFVRVDPEAITAATPVAAGSAGTPLDPPRRVGESWRRWLATGWILPAAAGAGALAIALLIFGMFAGGPARDPTVALPSGPTVFVAQYELIDGPDFARILRNGLQYELINSLSRFPELSVLGIDTVYGAPGGGAGRNLYGADFILQGSVQATARDVLVTSQLLETGNNTVVWSRTDRTQASDAS